MGTVRDGTGRERKGRDRTVLACGECGQQLARWAGRCPGCGAWGTIEERSGGTAAAAITLAPLPLERPDDARRSTGLAGVDRVLGGGLVPATVALLAGEPGIGKSTLLLQMVANLSNAGLRCVLASGEESHAQVAARASRLGLDAREVEFVAGRDLNDVVDVAAGTSPFLLAVDSIQTLRDPAATHSPGGPAQVRSCADALVGLAKGQGICVLMTGHVTKDGDVAGPRTLEHAVDVVLTFDGDPRSGLRMLAGGKNRFGAEGEVACFEMTAMGLREIDAADLLVHGDGEPGSAIALPQAGRRAIAVEVQALVAPTEGSPRRQTSGLDARRFQLVAAVLERNEFPVARSDLYGASAGGIRVDDPGCDLALAAALASSATDAPAPPGSAFVGEVSLTGIVRGGAIAQRLAAARAAGVRTVFAPRGTAEEPGLRIVPVRHVNDALTWAARRRGRGADRRPA